MEKTIEEIYDMEGRNPWSIKRWLKAEGFDEEIINQVLHEYANKMGAGNRYGYENGISLLSRSIRNRVKELSVDREKKSFDKDGKYILAKPFRQFLIRKMLGRGQWP